MKKVLSFLFAVIILCMCIIPSYAANYGVSVKAPYTATAGETISVSVLLSANSGLKFNNLTKLTPETHSVLSPVYVQTPLHL